ncbi:MAG TPA: tail fiber protein [Candidatus Tectomicrobia bacterium]
MEPFLGQIQLFPYTFAPQGWASCDGQLLAIKVSEMPVSRVPRTS